MKTTGFLSSSDGGRSSTRLVFVVGSGWNMALCSFMAIQGTGEAGLIALFSAIQGVLIGLKLGQKPMEGKTSEK